MAGIVRVGDRAGGSILNTRGISTTLSGRAIAVSGMSITPHGKKKHKVARTTNSARSTINGISIVKSGNRATCGHTASASAGSSIG